MNAATKRPRTQHPGTGKETTTPATWRAMHNAYVDNYGPDAISIVSLANQHGVNVNATRNRANDEHWSLERDVRGLRAELAKAPEARRWRRYCTAADLSRAEEWWKLELSKMWKTSVTWREHKLAPYLAAQLPSEPEMEAILARKELERWERLTPGLGYDLQAIAEHRLEAEAVIAKWNRMQGAAAVSLPPDPGLAPVIDLAAYRVARAGGFAGSAA